MALIALCAYDTEENGRSEYTRRTIESLYETVDYYKHRIIVVDNGSCERTKSYLERHKFMYGFDVITLPENIGTAKGINKAWKFRKPGENAVKLDNDVVFYQEGWADRLEEAIERDPQIGIIGLKRKDLEERPDHENEWYKSALYFLAHSPGQSWIPFEEVIHVMGTCQMYSSACLDKIGYLVQPGIYGFDDSLASFRARLAGFVVGFLPSIQIDHIDTGDNPYSQEKQKLAGEGMAEYVELCRKYQSGELSLYHAG